MLIHPNHSSAYRNWAYCCAKIRKLQKEFDLNATGKPPTPAAHYFLQANGRAAFMKRCQNRCNELEKKISRYTALRDKLAVKLGSPEKHLLQIEDIVNMVGNVLEITPRHKKKKVYISLYKCSPDGKSVNGYDAYKLMSFGYGK